MFMHVDTLTLVYIQYGKFIFKCSVSKRSMEESHDRVGVPSNSADGETTAAQESLSILIQKPTVGDDFDARIKQLHQQRAAWKCAQRRYAQISSRGRSARARESR